MLRPKVFRIGSQIDFQVGWDPSRSPEEPDDANIKQGTGRGDWSALEMCGIGISASAPSRRANANSPPPKEKEKKKKGREKEEKI